MKLRIDFHHHVILIELRENGGDLALAKRVVKGVINVGGQNSQARGSVAVNGERSQEPLVHLVRGYIAQFGKAFQLINEAWHPISQLFSVDIFETVLKLRAADAVFNGEVLDGLHEQRNTIYFSKLRLQTSNYFPGINLSHRERLQINLKPPTVQGHVGSINANEGRKRLDGWEK